MKKAIIICMLIIPFLASSGQSKKELRKERRQQREEKYNEEWSKSKKTFTSNFDESGYYLQKASSFIVTGSVLEILGAATIAVGSNSDSKDAMTVGGATLSAIGLIVQIIGFSKIGKAGDALRKANKISFSGTGISYSF